MFSLFPSFSLPGVRIDQKIWQLAWPMILANISIPLLGFVDTAVIGHLSSSHFLAGTALASLYISVVFWLLGFLRMSTTGLVAQAMGAQNTHKAAFHLWQALLLGFLLAMIIIVFQAPLFQLIQTLSSDDVSMQQTYDAAKTYFDIRIWAAPLVLSNMALTGFLIGSGKTKWVLKALLVCNLVNLLADLLFVPVLGWGVAGVAMASVLAELVQFTMLFSLIWPQLKTVKVKLAEVLSGWSVLLKMNGNLFLRSALLQLCLSFMTIYATQFGTQAVAINSIMMQFFLFISFSLDGVAFALESLVGNTFGQNKKRRLAGYIKRGLVIGLAFSLAYTVFYILFVDAIVALLTNIEALVSGIQEYYVWIFIMPLTSVLSFLFDGIFVGLGWDKKMRNSMFIAALMFLLCVFIFQDLGNHGLWIAFSSFMLMRGLAQGLMMKRHLF